MKYDEFAFLNQQLAAMLRDGIPLEGALQQLCADMKGGGLRSELENLGNDLAKGVPLADALAARQLPDLYKRLLLVGAKSNDMPGVLSLLADYYQRQHNLWTRLKGLMVYPCIVLFTGFLVSLVFYFVWGRIVGRSLAETFSGLLEGSQLPAMTRITMPLMNNLWIFPVLIGLMCAAVVVVVCLPGLRRLAQWRLPAFHEASIANTASTLWLLLKGGISLPDSLGLVEQMETNSKVRGEISAWAKRLSGGVTKFSAMAAGGRIFPPLFVWLVSSAGENLAAGFQQAAEIYQGRAAYRSEMLLYAALPLMVLVLGVIILTQGWMVMSGLVAFMNLLGGAGD